VSVSVSWNVSFNDWRGSRPLQGTERVKKSRNYTFAHDFARAIVDLQDSFPDRFTSKFVIKSLLNIPPHFKCVETLTCEY